MVGFFDPPDGNQAEAAAVSETATTAGRAAATTTGPFGARVAMDAGDGVTPCTGALSLIKDNASD
jgi:hypothetical protein